MDFVETRNLLEKARANLGRITNESENVRMLAWSVTNVIDALDRVVDEMHAEDTYRMEQNERR